MMPNYFGDFTHAIEYSLNLLKTYGREVDTGHWQGVPTGGKPDLVTLEALDLQFNVGMMRVGWVESQTDWLEEIADEIKPNLPWADEHFAERVGRVPTNPGEAYKHWPWWQGQETLTHAGHDSLKAGDRDFEHGFKFTHTYQERFWPRHAGAIKDFEGRGSEYNYGIRYRYGDLDDVVNLLQKHPYTRQATLPIFFPEDTGAVHGGRVPCTLHYHFLLRDNRLHLWYPIRSCDAVRHFRDDLYLATRLCGWVIEQLVERELRSTAPQVWVDVNPGTLHFAAYSFHAHKGDLHRL
jgi:hypothetical protein